MPSPFPALKSGKVLGILTSLGYEETRRKGSHKTLEAPNRPKLTFAFHGGDEIAPGVLRDILVKQVGLSLEEALEEVRK